ncbi:MAG: glutaredoxin family protein [Conexibacter sp.]
MAAAEPATLTPRAVELERLAQELLDAHEDTVQLATAAATRVEWQVHLDYLRALQRAAHEALARCARCDAATLPPVPDVVLYGKPDCHLCDDARAVLERVRAELPFALSERDITVDDALHRAYLERIPVVTIDGEEIFDFFVDERELRRRLLG